MPINGIGTYSLHGDTCINAIKAALDSGVQLIDAAHMYGNEDEDSQTVQKSGIPREEVFVITKIYPGEDMAAPEKVIQVCLHGQDSFVPWYNQHNTIWALKA